MRAKSSNNDLGETMATTEGTKPTEGSGNGTSPSSKSTTPTPSTAKEESGQSSTTDIAMRRQACATSPSRRVKTPNCTHVNMDRVHGPNLICHVCGREPSLGFLYACRQDLQSSPPIVPHDPEGLAEHARKEEGKSELRRDLEKHQLSDAVIKLAERGEYTDEQLSKLKQQKANLIQTIEDAIQSSQTNSLASRLSAVPLASVDGTFNSLIKDNPVTAPVCQFRACHTCRPYYKDRIYSSFEDIMSDSQSPLSISDVLESHLPVKDARILRNIGLGPKPVTKQPDDSSTPPLQTEFVESSSLRDSMATFDTTQTDKSNIARIQSPRRRFYALSNKSSTSIPRTPSSPSTGHFTGFRSAIQGVFKNGSKDRQTPSKGSNATLPLRRFGAEPDNIVTQTVEVSGRKFDVGPRRRLVKRQKKVVNLPDGTPSGVYEVRKTEHTSFGNKGGGNPNPEQAQGEQDVEMKDVDAGDDSSTSDFTVCSSISDGSEVEVAGGVALTEEAVETHIPDILNTAVTETESQAVESEFDSIMTQV